MTRISHVVLAVAVLLGCTPVIAGSHASGFVGEVLIDTKDSAVFVLIDTNKGGKDGLVDQWFRLESETPLPAISEHVPGAEIVQSDGYVRVMSPARRVSYDFVIAGTNPPPPTPAGFTSIRLEGYGISHTTGSTTIRIPDVRRNHATAFQCEGCEVLDPCIDCGGGGAMSCTAGGEGSTSCSITSGGLSCSASCGQGYYACCNYTAYAVSCKCYRS